MLTTQQIMAAAYGYMGCALWSEHCNGTASHDGCRGEDCDTSFDILGLGIDDIDLDSRNEMIDIVHDFVKLCEDQRPDCLDGMDAGRIGYDFWLTRNRHGAGFWDRGLGELGDWLTQQCKPYGEASLYVGADGMIHYNG